MAGAEKQLTQRACIHLKTHGQHAGPVTAQQCLHVTIEAFDAVVGQHQQARDACTAGHIAASISQTKSSLFSSERALGALQAAHHPAGTLGTTQSRGKF
jgi:hypothetical protein